MGALTGYTYEAFQGHAELIQYDPAKAYTGYTLFSPFQGSNPYLIDMEGIDTKGKNNGDPCEVT